MTHVCLTHGFHRVANVAKLAAKLVTDDDLFALQAVLVNRPDAGALIRNGGGLRKIRIALQGRGKRGGARVVYYWVTADDQIILLSIYAKMKNKTSLPLKPKLSGGKSEAGREARIIAAAKRERKALESGEILPARVWEVLPDGRGGFIRRQLDPKSFNDATKARHALRLSQGEFATLLGVSKGTLQGWEQGRFKPNRAARILLKIAETNPKAVLAAASALPA